MSTIALIGYKPIRPWAAGFVVALAITSAIPASTPKACEHINPSTPARMVCTVEAIEPTHGHGEKHPIDWRKDPPPAWLQTTGTATEAGA